MSNIRYDLIPPQGITEVSKIFTKKLEKHGINDWKYGISWTKVLSTLKKHLTEFEKGNDFDEDNLLQIAHVAEEALILCEYYKIYPQGDDRLLGNISAPRVSLDIDDVCLDFKPAFEQRFNIKLNNYWDGSYLMGSLLDKVKDDKDFWVNLPVKNLPTFNPTCYITSRSISVDWTKECLEKNGFPCAPVYCVPFNESKVDLLKNNNINIHIDDKVQNYQEAITAGIFCYLMDAPHNQWFNVPQHRRIYDLNLNI